MIGFTTMPIDTHEFEVSSKGNCEVIDLTHQVAGIIEHGKIIGGVVTIFVVGSTAGITTTEFEPGLVHYDLKAAFEKIAPKDGVYRHEQTWHDDNGHSHVCASLLGPSISVPFVDRKMKLGTWQQIVLIDFDTRPRERKIIIQVLGE
jgi:secondary thiamine-phosphate synthase enzyme